LVPEEKNGEENVQKLLLDTLNEKKTRKKASPAKKTVH